MNKFYIFGIHQYIPYADKGGVVLVNTFLMGFLKNDRFVVENTFSLGRVL